MTDIYVFADQQIAVYVPPKCGSTSWRLHPNSNRLGTATPQTFPGYQHVAIWRDPVSRFLSLYSQFVVSGAYRQNRIESQFIEHRVPFHIRQRFFVNPGRDAGSIVQFVSQVIPILRDTENFHWTSQNSWHLYTSGRVLDQYDLVIRAGDQSRWAAENLNLTIPRENSTEWIYDFSRDSIPGEIAQAIKQQFPTDFIDSYRLYKY